MERLFHKPGLQALAVVQASWSDGNSMNMESELDWTLTSCVTLGRFLDISEFLF